MALSTGNVYVSYARMLSLCYSELKDARLLVVKAYSEFLKG